MSDYIRREDAIEIINQGRLTKLIDADVAESGLKNLTAADVTPVVHAHWIRHENADIICGYYVPSFECSQCGAWKEDDSDFCPDCGAKMDEEEKKNE